ncbi:Nucleotidyltransferase domain protein [Collinsella aerofaciens]|nr:Nucleotidyltransferase domain protein [Collinsella aerofaciens]
MKWAVDDCKSPSDPVKTLADAVSRSRAVFSDYPCVTKAVLFGSFSRGEQNNASDVDFFLGLDPSCTSSDYLALLDSLASALGRDVDVTVKLKGATDGFVYNIKTEGRLIYDRGRNQDIPSNAA